MSSLARRMQIRFYDKAGLEKVPYLFTTGKGKLVQSRTMPTRWPFTRQQTHFIDGIAYAGDVPAFKIAD